MAVKSSAIAEAQRLLREGRVEDAERLYERVLGETPENGEALNVVALGPLRSGDPQRAKSLLTRATQVNPADAASWHHLGSVQDALDDFAGAQSAFAEAVRLDPSSFLSRANLAAV